MISKNRETELRSPSVCGSTKNFSKQSTKFVPLNGSPPIPTQVDWPRPTAVVWKTCMKDKTKRLDILRKIRLNKILNFNIQEVAKAKDDGEIEI